MLVQVSIATIRIYPPILSPTSTSTPSLWDILEYQGTRGCTGGGGTGEGKGVGIGGIRGGDVHLDAAIPLYTAPSPPHPSPAPLRGIAPWGGKGAYRGGALRLGATGKGGMLSGCS